MAGEGREMKQREFVLCTRKKEEKSAPVVTGPQTCRICSGVTIIFAPPAGKHSLRALVHL